MHSLESPEELLDRLYTYLSRGKIDFAVRVFRDNSSSNQLSVFLRAVKSDKIRTIRTADYIVLLSNVRDHGLQSFVIGLDENYKFFCHNLPRDATRYILRCGNIDDLAVRKFMGFDFHAWETNYQSLENTRIRLQGDLVIKVEKIFGSFQDLKAFIENRIKNINTSNYLLAFSKKRRRSHYDADRIMQLIQKAERIIKVDIGNHKIRFIGVIDSLIPNYRLGLLRNELRALILRKHNLVAHHDEHKTVNFTIHPGIITLTTLNTGPIRFNRQRLPHFEYDGIIRIKVVIVDSSNLGSWRLLSNVPQDVALRRFVGLDAEFYVLRKTIKMEYKRVLFEVLVWYLQKDRVDYLDGVYVKGANIVMLLADENRDKLLSSIRSIQTALRKTKKFPPLVILSKAEIKDKNPLIEKLLALRWRKIIIKETQRIDGETTINTIFEILERILKEKLEKQNKK